MLHFCPGHPAASVAQSRVEAAPGDGWLELADGVTHSHARHRAAYIAAAGDTGKHAASPDTADTAQGDKATKAAASTDQKCSTCASCCAGLALPRAAAVPPAFDPVREVSVLPRFWAASIVSDGPERPPRIPRA